MKDNKIYYLILSAATIIVILSLLLFNISNQADTVSVDTEITNTAPTVDSVFISDTANGLVDDYSGGTITPTAGAAKTLHINGVVSDANGTADIASVKMAFYRSGATNGSACTADQNDCYPVVGCALSADTATTKKYNCEIAVQFWADSTDTGGRFSAEDWQVYVEAEDNTATTGSNNSVSKEIGTVLSVNIPTSIVYGTFGLGESTTALNNNEMLITQQGNDEADVEVSGTAMTCSNIGVIPDSNQKWALTDVGAASGISLSSSATSTNIGIGYKDEDLTDVSKTLYWNITIPETGVKGVCTGSNTISVIASGDPEGILVDSLIVNADYTSPSYSGVTDANGKFTYKAGETVTFKIGEIALGTISNMPADGYVFMQDLVGVPRTDTTHPAVLNIARLLQSIDDDGDISTAINITNAVKSNYTQAISAQTATENDLNNLVSAAGKSLVSVASAENHLNISYDVIMGAAACEFNVTTMLCQIP